MSSLSTLKFMPDEDKFREEVSIDPNDITGAMMTNAAMFAHYGHMAAKAEHQYDQLKTRMSKLEAILYAQHREALQAEKGKPSEAMVDAAVKGDPRWLKLNDQLAQAKLVMAMQDVNKRAFLQRGEFLRSIGADLREERRGDIRTMAVESKESELDASKKRALEIARGQS
jgi:hypothetical protein